MWFLKHSTVSALWCRTTPRRPVCQYNSSSVQVLKFDLFLLYWKCTMHCCLTFSGCQTQLCGSPRQTAIKLRHLPGISILGRWAWTRCEPLRGIPPTGRRCQKPDCNATEHLYICTTAFGLLTVYTAYFLMPIKPSLLYHQSNFYRWFRQIWWTNILI